ncbi:MAG: HAD family hydrolase [Planctomycetes bacterium]|nr:HAD family hydrolase [Planctomycetota bacterium]
MPLTLEQYASYLDTRNLPWPAAPEVDSPKAKPHLKRLRGIRAVLWNVYGTLLAIPGGELYFEHPQKLQMDVALDKTVQEFKMWGSMTRKPGQPGEYLGQLYSMALAEQRVSTGGEKHPEVSAERVWEALIKKLLQKEYKFDAGFYGALNEFSRKVAYFFHASLQGSGCYPGAALALRAIAGAGLTQGLLADGQCFTSVQLQRGLIAQDAAARLEELVPPELRFLSCDVRARKPSERLFRHALQALADKGIASTQVLHISSRLQRDLVPARRLGMKTALFAGDRASLQATPEQLNERASRPNVLLTELSQLAHVIG